MCSIYSQVILALLLIVLVAAPFEYLSRAVQWLLLADRDALGPALLRWRAMVAMMRFWTWPFGTWAAGCLLVLQEGQARASEQRGAAARPTAQEAQLRALRYQINPHFLHNTLNAITALILDGRNAEAEEKVLSLGDFFRTSLAQHPLLDSNVQDEIAL